MTRTRRALRLSPLAFALAFGAYCENPVPAGRNAIASAPQQEIASLEADPRVQGLGRRTNTAPDRGTPKA